EEQISRGRRRPGAGRGVARAGPGAAHRPGRGPGPAHRASHGRGHHPPGRDEPALRPGRRLHDGPRRGNARQRDGDGLHRGRGAPHRPAPGGRQRHLLPGDPPGAAQRGPGVHPHPAGRQRAAAVGRLRAPAVRGGLLQRGHHAGRAGGAGGVRRAMGRRGGDHPRAGARQVRGLRAGAGPQRAAGFPGVDAGPDGALRGRRRHRHRHAGCVPGPVRELPARGAAGAAPGAPARRAAPGDGGDLHGGRAAPGRSPGVAAARRRRGRRAHGDGELPRGGAPHRLPGAQRGGDPPRHRSAAARAVRGGGRPQRPRGDRAPGAGPRLGPRLQPPLPPWRRRGRGARPARSGAGGPLPRGAGLAAPPAPRAHGLGVQRGRRRRVGHGGRAGDRPVAGGPSAAPLGALRVAHGGGEGAVRLRVLHLARHRAARLHRGAAQHRHDRPRPRGRPRAGRGGVPAARGLAPPLHPARRPGGGGEPHGKLRLHFGLLDGRRRAPRQHLLPQRPLQLRAVGHPGDLFHHRHPPGLPHAHGRGAVRGLRQAGEREPVHRRCGRGRGQPRRTPGVGQAQARSARRLQAI
ncbi:MAG: hypothetical protein AVDCRST_MAG68-4849, partial [uncultured Gemmatimonadetes bacterium]